MAEDELLSEVKSDYTFRLEGFEGPLDLLLHLIQKNSWIFSTSHFLITEQYLNISN